MRSIYSCLVVLLMLFLGCKKEEVSPYEQQAQIDEQKIKEFIASNNINATRHSSGLYYVITNPGTGNFIYKTNTEVTVKYKLRLLSGQVIPQTEEPIEFALNEVILGWGYGVPLIQKGGKIRLIIPSGYAYGPYPKSGIPANSVLDFDIELLNIN